jgi:hypothetical protein
LATLFFGGLVFGPIVQKFAFGDFWTGVPFGIDLTDNKTLIAFIGWLLALFAVWKYKSPRIAVIAASALMLIIFIIPHSTLGSELDYSEMEIKQASISESSKDLFPFDRSRRFAGDIVYYAVYALDFPSYPGRGTL